MEKRNLEQRCAIKFCVKLNENATETYEKLKKGLMESMLCQGHRFLGGMKHFWMAVRVWKTNLVLEDLARQKTDENVTKVRDLVRSDRRFTVRMISSVLNLKSPNRPRNFDLRTGHAENLCQAGPKNPHQ